MPILFAAELETPRGVFSIIFHQGAIHRVCFPGTAPAPKYPAAALPWPGFAEDLDRYLRGEQVCWDRYPLDTAGYAPFTARLLEAVRQIPHGTVWSYREAAIRAESPRAWRAAGQALKANRHPVLVPCHRVIKSDGSLGGFSGPPGWKQMLLNLEKGW